MQHAAAASPFFGADSATPEREALLEAGRLGSLGELVRGLAHEINNPLFGMLGLVDVLLADLEPGSPEYDRLLLVRQSGLEIKQITHSLLRFARVAARAPDPKNPKRPSCRLVVQAMRQGFFRFP